MARKLSIAQRSTRRYLKQHGAGAREYKQRTGSKQGYKGSPEHKRVEKRRKQWIRDEGRRVVARVERDNLARMGKRLQVGDDPTDDIELELVEDYEDDDLDEEEEVDLDADGDLLDGDDPIQLDFPEGPYWDMLDIEIVRQLIEDAQDAGQHLRFWFQEFSETPEFVGYKRIDMELFISEEYYNAVVADQNFQEYWFYRWRYVERGELSHFILIKTDMANGKEDYFSKV